MSIIWCANCEEEAIVVPNFPQHAGDEPWCLREGRANCAHFLCAKCKDEQENAEPGDRELSDFYGGGGPQ